MDGVGVHGPVKRALDLRSDGYGLIPRGVHALESWAIFTFHTAHTHRCDGYIGAQIHSLIKCCM